MVDRNEKTESEGPPQADTKLAEFFIQSRRKGERMTKRVAYSENPLGDFIMRAFYLCCGHALEPLLWTKHPPFVCYVTRSNMPLYRPVFNILCSLIFCTVLPEEGGRKWQGT